MAYTVDYAERVEKQIRRLPEDTQRRVVAAIGKLREEPRPSGVKKLVGNFRPDQWRVRVGDFRIVYTIEDKVLLVAIMKVDNRKDVY